MYKPSKPVASIISMVKYTRMVTLAEKSYLRSVFVSMPLTPYLKSKFNIYESVSYPGIIHQGYCYIPIGVAEVLRVKCLPEKDVLMGIEKEYRSRVDWFEVRKEQLAHMGSVLKILPYRQTKTYLERHQ